MSGRNQPSANGPSLIKAPKVRIFLLPLSKDTWQTWCMRRTENPENVVRVHECPRHNAGIAQSVERRSPKPKVVGSSPSACAIILGCCIAAIAGDCKSPVFGHRRFESYRPNNMLP